MATCLRCLARTNIKPGVPHHPSTGQIATFSSATYNQATNRKGPATGGNASQRSTRTLRLGKKRVETRTRGSARPGERKEVRKRIVLSNTNAHEIYGLKEWNRVTAANDSIQGTMMTLSGPTVDSLRALESFKPTQGWNLFRRPATLIRTETMELARHIRNVGRLSGDDKTLRRIVTGDRSSGKSVLLLQAQAAALEAGWVVLHIPEAQFLTNATTDYAPLPQTSPTRYFQKSYVSALLSRIAQANGPILDNLQLTQQHTDLPIPLQENMSLTRLAETAGINKDVAWPLFSAFWKELTAPGRPPILLTADNVVHMARLSHYVNPDMHYIHAHDLALVDHFIKQISGAEKLPNGGMVLGADSFSNRPAAPTFDVAVRQSEATNGGGEAAKLPLYDIDQPYAKQDPRVLETWRTVPVLRLPGLGREDVRTLLEYYNESGLLRSEVTDHLVAERWALSGNGIIGELERSSVKPFA